MFIIIFILQDKIYHVFYEYIVHSKLHACYKVMDLNFLLSRNILSFLLRTKYKFKRVKTFHKEKISVQNFFKNQKIIIIIYKFKLLHIYS